MGKTALPSIKESRLSLLNEIIPSYKEQPVNNDRVYLKTKTVLIYDYGVHTEFAIRLAKDYKKVYYYCHWEASLPKSNLALIGTGMDNVERVMSFLDYVDKVDLICCFDTYTSDIVGYLRKSGYRVWGAGKSEVLETDRWKSRQIQKAVGLPHQNTKHIIGIENLIDYLKGNENKFVKINKFRGDIETFHHDKYDETEAQYLGKIIHDFGAKGKTMEFIVEDAVGEVEPGLDGWVIDGEYPEVVMYGYENKDSSYLGRTSFFNNVPESVRTSCEKLAPVFKKLGGRTFFSTEIRVDKQGIGYLIDPTVRVPLPPSGVHLEMWKNLSEIIWYGAGGEVITPKAAGIYGAEIILTSSWAEDNWLYIDFPEEIRQWVKLRMAFQTEEGKHYAVPGNTFIGTVVGIGNTPQEAIDKVKERVVKVKARDLDFDIGGLDHILNDMVSKGRRLGIKF